MGAVVTDPTGRIVARGRSRRSETSAPDNQLAGSRLAHAEVNALAQLAVDQHAGCQLYVTLEPCLLCWAAISMAKVRTVHFASVDPVWRFLDEVSHSHPELASRAYESIGPMKGPHGLWATLLPLLERLWRDLSGVRVDHYLETVPDLVDLAMRLAKDGTADRFVGMAHHDALALVWDDLLRLSW